MLPCKEFSQLPEFTQMLYVRPEPVKEQAFTKKVTAVNCKSQLNVNNESVGNPRSHEEQPKPKSSVYVVHGQNYHPYFLSPKPEVSYEQVVSEQEYDFSRSEPEVSHEQVVPGQGYDEYLEIQEKNDEENAQDQEESQIIQQNFQSVKNSDDESPKSNSAPPPKDWLDA